MCIADTAFVSQPEFIAAGFASLGDDFGIIDVVIRLAMPAFDIGTGFAEAVAVQDAGEFEVLGVAVTTVVVGLVGSGNGLVVVIAAGVECEFPISVRDAVVQPPVVGVPMAASVDIALVIGGADFVIAGQVRAVAEVEQVVEPEWAVY